jgi:tRNA U34 2-thiouridine synthase MnmA/TrmU
LSSEKRVKDNAVVVGDEALLFSRRMALRQVKWHSSRGRRGPSRRRSNRGTGRRRRTPATPRAKTCTALVEFDRPQRALTCGQAAVFYDATSCWEAAPSQGPVAIDRFAAKGTT